MLVSSNAEKTRDINLIEYKMVTSSFLIEFATVKRLFLSRFLYIFALRLRQIKFKSNCRDNLTIIIIYVNTSISRSSQFLIFKFIRRVLFWNIQSGIKYISRIGNVKKPSYVCLHLHCSHKRLQIFTNCRNFWVPIVLFIFASFAYLRIYIFYGQRSSVKWNSEMSLLRE